MGEAVGLGASILTLASFGVTVVKTLRSFSGSYTGAEQRIKDLSGDVALTVSKLTELSATVSEYETEFKVTVHNFRATKDVCERNFGRLERASREVRGERRSEADAVKAIEEGKERGKGNGKEKLKEKKISTWERLCFCAGW